MANTNSPGSSPPDISYPDWEEVDVTSSGSFTTWRRTGLVPWQVEWEEAHVYAADFYDHVSQFPNAPTHGGTCLAAALVALFREEEEQEMVDGSKVKVLSGIKSMVFLSTIPRGLDSTSVHGTISDSRRCHAAWKGHCYYTGEIASKKKGGKPTLAVFQGPTELHAEDSAIDMMLTLANQLAAAQAAADQRAAAGHPPNSDEAPPRRFHWLGDMSMVIDGVKAYMIPGPEPKKGQKRTYTRAVTPRGQRWPCGPGDLTTETQKQPCCQDILDRMNIKWRFGAYPRPSTPESQLPQYPPGYSGGSGSGSGSGSGGGGGGHPGYASSPQPEPSSDYGSDAFSPSFFQSAAGAQVRNVLADRAFAAKHGGTPVHVHPSRAARKRVAVLPNSRNTHPRGTILSRYSKPASLSGTLARMSLNDKRAGARQPGVNAVQAQPPHLQHTTGVGGVGRVMRPPAQVSSPATKKPPAQVSPAVTRNPPATGPQVAGARPLAKTAVAQQRTTGHGGNGSL